MLRDLVSLPLLAGKRLEAEGRRDDALKMYVLALRMGAHLGQDPFGCNGISAFQFDAKGLRAIEDWLWSGPKDEETVAAVQKRVHALSQGRPRWEPVAAAELVLFDETVERLQQEPEFLDSYDFGWGFLETARKNLVRTEAGQEILRRDSPWLREQLARRLALPLHEYLRTLPEYDAAVRRRILWLTPGRIVAEMSECRATRSYYGTDELYWTAFDVQCALLRYKAAHGRFPDGLAELGPSMPSLGTDPFTNEPLKYRLEPDGSCTFWSVGKDLVDDGGVRPEDGKHWNEHDYVWSSAEIPGGQ